MDPLIATAAGTELLVFTKNSLDWWKKRLPAQKTKDGFEHLCRAFDQLDADFDIMPYDMQKKLLNRYKREILQKSSAEARTNILDEVVNGHRARAHDIGVPPEILAELREMLHSLRISLQSTRSNGSVSEDQPQAASTITSTECIARKASSSRVETAVTTTDWIHDRTATAAEAYTNCFRPRKVQVDSGETTTMVRRGSTQEIKPIDGGHDKQITGSQHRATVESIEGSTFLSTYSNSHFDCTCWRRKSEQRPRKLGQAVLQCGSPGLITVITSLSACNLPGNGICNIVRIKATKHFRAYPDASASAEAPPVLLQSPDARRGDSPHEVGLNCRLRLSTRETNGRRARMNVKC
ncbi:hypothetical protein B0H12DRAFT_1070661 [Mycena haematopus]|nr:hypothetical protein B0H12DRAFT_1070661 [Mycena haematopus]